ncbi:MAG TPA: hypothetical protein DEQ62_08580, partial [Verrucomicrobiales bacterium]|nr:hypothetical protein [Verrucomicrobiales bacterium]
ADVEAGEVASTPKIQNAHRKYIEQTRCPLCLCGKEMKAAIYIITLLVTPLWAGTPEAMVLLKSNCFSCHNPEKEKGGLDLTSREAIMAGGD